MPNISVNYSHGKEIEVQVSQSATSADIERFEKSLDNQLSVIKSLLESK